MESLLTSLYTSRRGECVCLCIIVVRGVLLPEWEGEHGMLGNPIILMFVLLVKWHLKLSLKVCDECSPEWVGVEVEGEDGGHGGTEAKVHVAEHDHTPGAHTHIAHAEREG